MPFLSTNMSRDVCYRVFYGEILRYARLSSHMGDFEARVRITGEMLLARGYDFRGLRREFGRVLCKYRGEFEKWYVPLDIHGWFGLIFHPTGSRVQDRVTGSGVDTGGFSAFSQRVRIGGNIQQAGFISQP